MVSLVLAGVAVAGYAAICALVSWKQTSLMFFPVREIQATPRDIGLDYRQWEVSSSDGARIQAWEIPAPAGGRSAVVLFCHGNGGNISHRLGVARELHRLGLGVVLFDYRGYGQSQGALQRESQLLDDAQAVYARIAQSGHPILLYGESLGGGVAAALAEKNPYQALVLQSTFTSLTDRASQDFPWLPVRQLSRFQLSTRARLSKLHGPVLVMHSPDDEVIGFSHGQKLYAAAPQPKLWCELRGGHNDFDPESWSRGMKALLEQLPR